jgi:hypothetical protein
MKIYFLNENTKADIDVKQDLVLHKYDLGLNHNFSINFLGSYSKGMAVDFPGNGFYYSDYGIRDNFEVYYVEANKDNTELYFYEIFEHSLED